MSRRAHVASIDALRSFKTALQEFDEVVRQVLISLQTEVQRGRDWFEQDRVPYWHAEVRRAQDALVEDLNRLERKRLGPRTKCSQLAPRIGQKRGFVGERPDICWDAQCFRQTDR